MIFYISDGYLDPIFDLLAKRYTRAEEIPLYKIEKSGFDQFCGVLQQVQANTYYPSLFEKATYLLVSINKGHFFSNGNKRLALVTTTTFLSINHYQLKNKSKEWYKEFLGGLFPEYMNWKDYEDFTSTDFVTYNLSIMIADSGVYNISHDQLKERVVNFFENSTEKING